MLDKLKENGFQVKYIHPNTLFICWNHWVPSYVRTELKKKTGIIVDEYGRKIEGEDDSNKSLLTLSSNNDPQDINEIMFKVKETNNNNTKQTINIQKKFTPIKSYKPSGNLIYDDELLNRLEDKLN